MELGDDRSVLGAGGLVLIPSMVPHRFRNVGKTRARVVGFFSANTVLAEFEEAVMPIGRSVVGTPTPEMVDENK